MVVPLRTDTVSLACADVNSSAGGESTLLHCPEGADRVSFMRSLKYSGILASYPSPKESRFGDFLGVLQKTSICQISGESNSMPLCPCPGKGVGEVLGSWCLVILSMVRHLGRQLN